MRILQARKPILLVDQDDVLAEYIKGVIVEFNKEYDTDFTIEDCVDWDLVSIFGEQILDAMHRPKLFRELEPVANAIEVFERLYKSNLFEMYIVTAAHPSSVEPKHEWIKEYMPFFPLNHVIVCSKKQMIKGDYLLDDGLHNIKDFAEVGGTPIIFDRPHNRKEGIDYTRIGNWLEFEEWIMNECYPGQYTHYFEKEETAI